MGPAPHETNAERKYSEMTTQQTIGSKLRARAKKALAAMILTTCLMLAAAPAHAATTFTVNTTGDSLDSNAGDGFCLTGKAQECTLRAAVQEANATPGPNTIAFGISGAGVKVIDVNANGNDGLPPITDTVTINGYTQPVASANTLARGTDAKLMVVVNGADVPPAVNGLNLAANDSTIKGLAINGFSSSGVVINGSGNRIAGNFIGSGTSGAVDKGNAGNGVNVANGSGNTIGGASRAARNLISGNDREGVSVDAPNNTVRGNLVGTERDGLGALGNGANGVLVADGSTGVGIISNSIFSNGGLGIDLSPDFEGDGPTANDPGDSDTGSNNLQNKPAITSARTGATATTIKGRLSSAPDSIYFVQLFSSPRGNEGRIFLGTVEMKTDSLGEATFTFKPGSRVAAGQKITATATDEAALETSEFSRPREVVSAG